MKQKPPHQNTASREPGRQEMAALLERSGIILPGPGLDLLWSYHKRLRRYNPELNLTRIHNFANMVLKLYADSILPGRMVELPSPLLDLGTGPGMPGIPLKIAFPDLYVILAESRQNRNEFLQTTVQELNLEGISVLGHGITPAFAEPVAGVITRAVEEIGDTLERIEGCLLEGGTAVFMKGPRCDSEIEAAATRFSGSYRLLNDIAYTIPHTPHARRLVVFERTDAPPRVKKETAMSRHFFRSIESEQNDTFKEFKKLLTGKGIRKTGKALIAGTKQVEEVLAAFPDRSLAWISGPDQSPPPESAPGELSWYQFSAPLFKELDVSGTNAPLLLVRTPEIREWQPADGFADGCSVLVPFQDPENVGTIIRSAVAFGVRRIILLSEAAHPFHPKAVRASGGAVLHAELFHGPSIRDLPADLPIVPLSGEGMDISGYAFPAAFGLLPGIEGGGLPDHLREQAVAIPIDTAVESLNAAAAAAIALYVWARTVT